ELLDERFAVERHPSDAALLGRRSQPQVLDGKAGGVEAGVVDGVTTEHVRAAAGGVVGDDDTDARLQDPLDLDAFEHHGEVGWQRVAKALPLCRDVLLEDPSGRRTSHHDEVPRLRQTNARGAMGRFEDAAQGGGRDWFAGELRPDVTTTPDRVVDRVNLRNVHGQAGSVTAVA